MPLGFADHGGGCLRRGRLRMPAAGREVSDTLRAAHRPLTLPMHATQMVRLLGFLASLAIAASGFLVFASPSHYDQASGRQMMWIGAALAALTIMSVLSRAAYNTLKISLVVLVVGFCILFFLIQIIQVIG
jgi:hypothetical protein